MILADRADLRIAAAEVQEVRQELIELKHKEEAKRVKLIDK